METRNQGLTPGVLVSLIVAAAENGVIGRGGQLPWRLSGDLMRFKQLTMGHPIVMGRRTWESIGRPLPGRTSIVVTRQTDYATGFEDVAVANDVQSAIELAGDAAGGADEIFIIGGSLIYEAAWPHVERIYLTRVAAEVEGDAYLPEIDWRGWQQTAREPHRADAKNQYDYAFEIYERGSTPTNDK